MTTYTILTGEGEVIDTGLTLRDAAHEVPDFGQPLV